MPSHCSGFQAKPGQCYILIGLHSLCRYIGLLFFLLLLPFTKAHVQYRSGSRALYDTICRPPTVYCNILQLSFCMISISRSTSTTILSARGVTIPINLVSSATDSIRQCVVLFKLVPIPTSDPKSEFLCPSSLYCTELTDPLNHFICLGYLLHPCHHVSPILSFTKCSYWVPQTEAMLSAC